jgi:DNA-binding XRE family transcriptional regulator
VIAFDIYKISREAGEEFYIFYIPPVSNVQNFPIYRSEANPQCFSYLQVGMAKQIQKSKIDWYIITRVREMRIANELGQEDIALHLEVSTGYIGHIESPKFAAKYTTVQVNELAKLFKCSPKDFMPDKPL